MIERVLLVLLLCAAPALAQTGTAKEAPAGTADGTAATKRLNLPAGRDKANLSEGSIFFVGTATVILRYAGFVILTDPNFLHKGDHVHLGYGLRSERLTNPAIELDQLPPIDFVLLSHYHGDHFDQLVEEKLDRKIPIVSTPEAIGKLREKGFNAGTPLAKWETLTVAKGDAVLRISALPARHGPPVFNQALPETMGSLLEFLGPQGKPLYRIYITGDTLVFDEIAQIPKRYPEIDLALLHLGGTRAAGVLVTMDGKQGVEMLQIVKPDLALPIHFNDYTVFKSPLDEFVKAVRDAGLERKVRYLKHGDTYTFRVKQD